MSAQTENNDEPIHKVARLESDIVKAEATIAVDEDLSIKIKCGQSNYVLSTSTKLAAFSEFFKSMLALKEKGDDVIDLTSFCENEITLMTLILHINYHNCIPINWKISTTANMIFLVDPFLLSEPLQKHVIVNLGAIQATQSSFNSLLLELSRIIATRGPSELQIVLILSMLIRFEAPITPEQQSAINLQRNRNFGHSSQENVRYQPERQVALVIFALWLKEMHQRAEFVSLIELKAKYDVRVGATPPSVLAECDRIVPGLHQWIRIIYA